VENQAQTNSPSGLNFPGSVNFGQASPSVQGRVHASQHRFGPSADRSANSPPIQFTCARADEWTITATETCVQFAATAIRPLVPHAAAILHLRGGHHTTVSALRESGVIRPTSSTGLAKDAWTPLYIQNLRHFAASCSPTQGILRAETVIRPRVDGVKLGIVLRATSHERGSRGGVGRA